MGTPAVNWLPAELRAAGFTEPSLVKKFALNVCSSAMEKRGKTTWAFTAPAPLIALSTDTGTEEIAEANRRKGRKIALYKARVPKEAETLAAKEKEWGNTQKILAAVLKAATAGSIRTFIIDTGTEVWESLRLARFGKLTQVMPHHYGPVNAEMRDIVKELCEIRTLNTIWIHKSKKQYQQNKKGEDGWNGKYERAGFSDMGFLCSVVVRHDRFSNVDDNGNSSLHFRTTVEDSRHEADTVVGLELDDDMNNFATLAQLCFPESDEKDWK